MADITDTKPLLETAKIYEQILSKMPDDVYSIEELISIYEKVGDKDKVESFCQRLNKIKMGETVEPLDQKTENH